MVNSFAPCSCSASSRLSATPTAPNPATSTVDPSLTPATASAVVFTCLSIKAGELPFIQREYTTNQAVAKGTKLHEVSSPSPGGGGSARIERSECETGWGD